MSVRADQTTGTCTAYLPLCHSYATTLPFICNKIGLSRDEAINKIIFTMQNKFRNCFVWNSSSTSDLNLYIFFSNDTRGDHPTVKKLHDFQTLRQC